MAGVGILRYEIDGAAKLLDRRDGFCGRGIQGLQSGDDLVGAGRDLVDGGRGGIDRRAEMVHVARHERPGRVSIVSRVARELFAGFVIQHG